MAGCQPPGPLARPPGLLREIHGRADENHRFDSIRLHRGHVEKDVPFHAQSNGAALPDAKMIKEAQGVLRALPMCNRILRVGRSTVTACIGLDERIFPHELIAAGMDPVFLAARRHEEAGAALPHLQFRNTSRCR